MILKIDISNERFTFEHKINECKNAFESEKDLNFLKQLEEVYKALICKYQTGLIHLEIESAMLLL